MKYRRVIYPMLFGIYDTHVYINTHNRRVIYPMLFGIYDMHVYINTHNRRVIYPMLLECLECLEFSFPIVKIRPPVEKRKILGILDDVIMGPFKVIIRVIYGSKSTTVLHRVLAHPTL